MQVIKKKRHIIDKQGCCGNLLVANLPTTQDAMR